MPTIGAADQPVTQITVVEAGSGNQDDVLSVMRERAEFMASQPGCISISLHRSLDGRRIVNYVQWSDREQLRAAHESPEFRDKWARFGEMTDEIDPHLYEVACVLEGPAR